MEITPEDAYQSFYSQTLGEVIAQAEANGVYIPHLDKVTIAEETALKRYDAWEKRIDIDWQGRISEDMANY